MKNYFENINEESENFENSEKTDEKLLNSDFTKAQYPCRIAIYDDLLSTPRIITIEAQETSAYLDKIQLETYKAIESFGGSFSFMVIRELVENFIHASFIEPTISILDRGNKIRFTDQGPGISDISLAQKVGVTSATTPMKQYIRGVGSGLPIVKQYLEHSGGTLQIENNIKRGTVITISAHKDPGLGTINGRNQESNTEPNYPVLNSKEMQILELAEKLGALGPTELNAYFNTAVSTAYRQLKSLEEKGYLIADTEGDKKRLITQKGKIYIKNVHLQ